MSLRRLVNAGFSINLDNKIFRVYNKENDKTIFEGMYEKPNWVVRFEVKKATNKNDTIVNGVDNYSCIAWLAIDNESLKQLQTNYKVERLPISEGDISEYTEEVSKEIKSAIGRENSEELIESNAQNIHSDETTAEYDAGLTSHRTTKVDNLSTIEKLKGILVENPPDTLNSDVKQNEAML